MNRDNRQWHLEKTVSVGHIVSTLTMAMAVLYWANDIDKRVDQNTQKNEFQDQRQSRLEARFDTTRNELRQDLRAIHLKLDRLIERQAEGK